MAADRARAFDPARSRLAALLAIALVAASGGLLAEMNRLARLEPTPAVLTTAERPAPAAAPAPAEVKEAA